MAHYNLGVLYLRQGRAAAALRELEAALPDLEDLPQLHHGLAGAYQRLGRAERSRYHAALASRLRREAAEKSE